MIFDHHECNQSRLLMSFVALLFVALILFFTVYIDNPTALLETSLGFFRQFERTTPAFLGGMFGLLVLGGLVCFPVNVALAIIALLYKPIIAIPLILSGCTTSAIAGYTLGRIWGPHSFPFISEKSTDKVRDFVCENGLKSALLLRFLPVAPFTIVNITLGVVRVPIIPFTLSCVIGLLPGTILFTTFGYSLKAMVEDPSITLIGITLGCVLAGWLAFSYVKKNGKANSDHR